MVLNYNRILNNTIYYNFKKFLNNFKLIKNIESLLNHFTLKLKYLEIYYKNKVKFNKILILVELVKNLKDN